MYQANVRSIRRYESISLHHYPRIRHASKEEEPKREFGEDFRSAPCVPVIIGNHQNGRVGQALCQLFNVNTDVTKG